MDDIAIRVARLVERAKARVVREAGRRMEQVGQHLVNQVKLTLRGQRHGRRYRVPGTKGRYVKDEQGRFVLDPVTGKRKRRRGKLAYYTASAPGEPPAVATGRLRNSVTWTLERHDSGPVTEITTRVEPRVKYAGWLEEGTRRMKPRPYLKPTWQRERERVRAYLLRRYL